LKKIVGSEEQLEGENYDIEKQQLLRRRLYDYEKMHENKYCLTDSLLVILALDWFNKYCI
jgi:hypothetical protein